MTLQPEHLTALRKMAGMSKTEFASALGMHRVTIGAMEAGRAPIERRTWLAARAIADRPPWLDDPMLGMEQPAAE